MHKAIYKITAAAIMTALSFALSYLKFPLAFLFPSFLEINFTFVPVLIAYFLIGFQEALIVNLLRFVLKILIIGTSSMYMGELCDFLIGSSTIIAIFFVNRKTNKWLCLVLTGILTWTVSGIIFNLAIILPAYLVLMEISLDAIVSMMPEYLHATTGNFYVIYIFLVILPFNLILASIVFAINQMITMPVAKIRFIDENRTKVYKEKEKSSKE